MRLLFLFVLFFVSGSAFSQAAPYSRVDSLMREYKGKIKSPDELYKVIHFIRENFDADSLRFRASFIWITDNIAYDIKAYQKDDPSAAQLNYVIRNKKAICGGYAALLKYFCDAFNIDCEIVEGYGRTGKAKVYMNQPFLRNNHAWNSVKINNTWRLADATWAAGGVDDTDEENLVYHKKFDEIYYFTPPEKFILNHLPARKQFQFTSKAVDQKIFMKSPLYLSDFLKDDISLVSPDTSLIRAKMGDTIVFKLKTDKKISKLYAFSNRVKKAAYDSPTIYKEGWIEFCYPVRIQGIYNLYIKYYTSMSDGLVLLAYRLEVN